MLHELHVLRQAPHGRAALAVERDGEELAVAAGRDEGAEGLALEEADARELGWRDAGRAGEELARRHRGRPRCTGCGCDAQRVRSRCESEERVRG